MRACAVRVLTTPQVHDGDELVVLHVFHSAGLTFADLQEEKKEAVRMLEGALESAKAVLLPPRSVEISSQLIESDDVRQTLTTFCRNFDFVVVGSLGNSGASPIVLLNLSDFAQESARFCWAQCLSTCCRIVPHTFWSSDSSEWPSKSKSRTWRKRVAILRRSTRPRPPSRPAEVSPRASPCRTSRSSWRWVVFFLSLPPR
jgi:hypothetical protein